MSIHSSEFVRRFHEAFGHPVADGPQMPAPGRIALRLNLIAEEFSELCSACGWSAKIELQNVGGPVRLIEAADGLGDLDYVVQGMGLEFGFPMPQLAEAIHESNMSKLGADGRPITREDGKTLKGPAYRPPNIAAVLAWAELRAKARKGVLE